MPQTRSKYPDWAQQIVIHVIGFVLCFGILVVNVLEKFTEGAWLTVVVTGALVGLCMLIKRHYNGVYARLKRLDQILGALPTAAPTRALELLKSKPTAVLLVGSYSGLGIHSLLTVMKLFPRYFANVVFMSVGVVDSATFQGVEEVDRVRDETEEALKKYVALARGLSIPSDYRMGDLLCCLRVRRCGFLLSGGSMRRWKLRGRSILLRRGIRTNRFMYGRVTM